MVLVNKGVPLQVDEDQTAMQDSLAYLEWKATLFRRESFAVVRELGGAARVACYLEVALTQREMLL